MPKLHLWCLVSVAGPVGESVQATDAQKQPLETRTKFEKNGLCQNCTNGTLQPGACFFLWQVQWKSKIPAILCRSCAEDIAMVHFWHKPLFSELFGVLVSRFVGFSGFKVSGGSDLSGVEIPVVLRLRVVEISVGCRV